MKRFLTLFFFSCVSILMIHAQVIEVQELTNNSSKKIGLGKYNIVDINSKLEIHLNTDSLLVKISRSTKTNTVLMSQLDELNYVLSKQIEILKILEDSCSKASTNKSIKVLGNYSVMMNEFYNRLIENNQLRIKANDLFAEYYQNIGTIDQKMYPSSQAYVIKNLSSNGQAILDAIRNSDDINKVNVQLTGFIDTKANQNQKVHIENFDAYADGEFYEVERWVTSFSEDDIKAFNNTSKLAAQLNEVVSSGFDSLNVVLTNSIASYRCISDVLEQLKNIRTESDSLFTANEAIVSKFITELDTELSSLLNILKKVMDSKEGNIDALELFDRTRQAFIDKATALPNEIDSLFKTLPAQFMEVNQPFITLKDSIVQCELYLKEDVEKVKSMFQYTSNLFGPIKNSAQSAAAIGDEVFNFSINQLPPKGYINLKNTGMRENGAQLNLKLIVKSTADSTNLNRGVTIENQTITLQQVNLYSESKVSLILASPYGSNTAVTLDNRFQFAPSGSLLFKFGSRNSMTWNYLEPGLGINMSTPDFDLDGTPDVAFGAVFSILKDLAMVGWSYNIQTDSPFWFFGLSLPFSVPGAPINNIETTKFSSK